MNMPCPACRTLVEIGIHYTGRKLQCPECGQKFLLPDSEDELWGMAEDTEKESWQRKLSSQTAAPVEPETREADPVSWFPVVAKAVLQGILLSSVVVGIVYVLRMIAK